MVFILCIETSTKNCSVSVCKNGICISSKDHFSEEYSHSKHLHSYIEETIKQTGISFQDLNAICVSKGPGSFTGLRIGVSSAKGLAYGLDIPILSLESLEILAEGVDQKGILVPMIDARRMEVYTAAFNSEKKRLMQTKAEIITGNSFSDYLENKESCYFFGDGAQKIRSTLNHPNAVFLSDIHPSAKYMCAKAHKKYQNNEFENLASFEPFYLKDFVSHTLKK